MQFKFFSNLSSIAFGSISLATILSAALVFLICYIAIRILMKATKRAMDRSKLDDTLKHFIYMSVHAVLWILAVIIAAETLGIPTASLVALFSVVGLAMSLSIQNIMANLFSGITVLATHPFLAGDYIEVGANQGTVKNVGLFYTVITTLDNKVVSIPNSDVTSASVINYSKDPLRRVDMTFSASYDAATESVRAAILDAAAADGRIRTDPAPFVALSKYKDSSIEYVTRVWCKNEDYWDVYFGMNERVRECFAARGVEMSYSHVNVHVMK